MDALQRVKGFVDRKVATVMESSDQEEKDDEERRATSIKLVYDEEGNITEAVPAYSAAEPKPRAVRFVYDADGNLTDGIPVFEPEMAGE